MTCRLSLLCNTTFWVSYSYYRISLLLGAFSPLRYWIRFIWSIAIVFCKSSELDNEVFDKRCNFYVDIVCYVSIFVLLVFGVVHIVRNHQEGRRFPYLNEVWWQRRMVGWWLLFACFVIVILNFYLSELDRLPKFKLNIIHGDVIIHRRRYLSLA